MFFLFFNFSLKIDINIFNYFFFGYLFNGIFKIIIEYIILYVNELDVF